MGAFNEFCREKRFKHTKWTSQFYTGPLSDFNVRIVTKCIKRYPNKPGAETYGGIFFIGVDVK